jgi:hypothetical protein
MGIPPILPHAQSVHPSGADASPCTHRHSYRVGLTAPFPGHGSNRSRRRGPPDHRGPPAGPHHGHYPGQGGLALGRFNQTDHLSPRRFRLTVVRHRSDIHRSRARWPCSPVYFLTSGHHTGTVERHGATGAGRYRSNACHLAAGANSNSSLKADLRLSAGGAELKNEVGVYLNVLVHLQHAEHLAEAANTVILEVERKIGTHSGG